MLKLQQLKLSVVFPTRNVCMFVYSLRAASPIYGMFIVKFSFSYEWYENNFRNEKTGNISISTCVGEMAV